MVAVSPARTSGGTVKATLTSIRELIVVSVCTTWMSVKNVGTIGGPMTPGRKSYRGGAPRPRQHPMDTSRPLAMSGTPKKP